MERDTFLTVDVAWNTKSETVFLSVMILDSWFLSHVINVVNCEFW